MKVSVVGAGYVGLVTAAVFSKLGHHCWVIEKDKTKIDKLLKGETPFYEPGLKDLLIENIKANRLYFTQDYKEGISVSEIIIICVGTPNKNGQVDLRYLYSAVKSVAKSLTRPVIVVIKSTVPPGTNSKVIKKMKALTRVKFEVASVPEFLREGNAVNDSLFPYRVVIGAKNKFVIKKLLLLHEGISGERIICSPESAQMIKYAANAFLPMKISFINSIAILCEKFNADVEDVRKAIGLDKRIGLDFLNPGLGYGGSCFPKDLEALSAISKEADFEFPLVDATIKTNQLIIGHFLRKISWVCGGSIRNKILTVLGIAFKPGTSDIRESRPLYLIKELLKRGAKVRACDPVAIPEAKKVLPDVEYFPDPYLSLKNADCLILGSGPSAWEEYQNLDFKKVKTLMRRKVVVDSWNVYNKEKLEKLGFKYVGIGR